MDPQLIAFMAAFSAACLCWKAAPVFVCWARVRSGGAPVGILRLWWLYFRNVPLEAVSEAYLVACNAGVSVRLADLAAHALVGGDVREAVSAYVETLRAGSRIEFSRVCEIDLEES